MRKLRYEKEVKEKAEKLRREGKTYKELTQKLGVPKSTLSVWLGKKIPGIFDRKAQLKHLTKIRPLASAAKSRKIILEDEALRKKIKKEFNNFKFKNSGIFKLILATLYITEGARYKGVSGLIFVNTDPKLIKLYISLLRLCYELDEKKFKIRLHLHYYHKIKNTRKYWSNILNIPLDQFGKIYLKKRSKTKRFRKNFMGICFIRYSDSSIRKELIMLADQFYEYIIEKMSL